MLICDSPPSTQMSTFKAVSAHVIHNFSIQLSLFSSLNCIYILLHIQVTVIKETLQFAYSWKYLFLFSTPSTSMEVFHIMRFLSCKR